MTPLPLDDAVGIARALGHAARLRTVAMLRGGELCVCQITEVLQLAPSTVSLHLKELRRAGLIAERKYGRWVFASLSKNPATRSWLDTALATMSADGQIKADSQLVVELRRIPVEELCRLGYARAVKRSPANPPTPQKDQTSAERARPRKGPGHGHS